MSMRLFPFVSAAINAGAALVYAYNKQWLLALVWACYATANLALGLIR